MDWELFKYWLNELSEIIIFNCPDTKLEKIYSSMSSYYQKHKGD